MLAIALILSSCSMNRIEKYPESWPVLRGATCPNLSGTYAYVGKFSPRAYEALRTTPKFDRWIFSNMVDRNLGSKDYVVVSHDVRNNLLSARFFMAPGRMVGELSEHLDCQASGYTKKRTSNIGGEGTYGVAEITQRFLISDRGSLIVFTQVMTNQRDFGIFPFSRNEETWAEFERKEASVGRKSVAPSAERNAVAFAIRRRSRRR